MEPDLSKYALEGDNSMYADEHGLVVPVVTRAGSEPGDTGQSAGARRISGVSIQHTPAMKLWFGQVHNLAGYRSAPHHHGEAETGGFVLAGRARIYFGEGGHGRVLQSRSWSSGTSGRLTTMFSGVRQVIQVSGLLRSRLHSMCGMNGGTKTQSPSPKS